MTLFRKRWRLAVETALVLVSFLGAVGEHWVANFLEHLLGSYFWFVWVALAVSVVVIVVEVWSKLKEKQDSPVLPNQRENVAVLINTVPVLPPHHSDPIKWISGTAPHGLLYSQGKMEDFNGLEHLRLNLRCTPGRQPVLDFLQQNRRVVIKGEPGSGKSVLLRKMCRTNCERLRDQLSATPEATELVTVPVYVELGLLFPDKSQSGVVVPSYSLEELICRSLGIVSRGDPLGSISSLFEEKQLNLLLLLDELNGIAPEYQKAAVNQILLLDQTLRAMNYADRVQVVITSRTYGFTDYFTQKGYRVTEVIPLDPEDVRSEILKEFPRRKSEIDKIYLSLHPKDRLILSNPQNLDNFITMCRVAIEKDGRLNVGSFSRANLLQNVIEQKLGKVDAHLREFILDFLGDLAYRLVNSGVFFSEEKLRETESETLKTRSSEYDRTRFLSMLTDTGLLVRVMDQFRFSHHSLQQFFAAREMKLRWRVAEYVRNSLWHEPMVILAGLLEQADPKKLSVLMGRIRKNTRLYAYLLASVRRAQETKDFLDLTVKVFLKRTHSWAKRLSISLTIASAVWFLGMMVLAGFVASLSNAELPWKLQALVLIGVISYVLLGPIALVSAHKAQFCYARDFLRDRLLPDLVVALRILQSRAKMIQALRDLERIRESLPFAPNDPRTSFVVEAIGLVDSAVNNPIILSQDEMLEHIDDPLIAAEIDAERLSTENIEKLFRIAIEAPDGPSVRHAIEHLSELAMRNPEYRLRVIQTLQEVLIAARHSYSTRKLARKACHQLGQSSVRGASFLGRMLELLKGFWRKLGVEHRRNIAGE